MTALACFYMQIPVGHVEAGLRTYNIYSPYPEEFNRQSVGILAQYNFAPTQMAADNLIREGKDPSKIFITGNTVSRYRFNIFYDIKIFSCRRSFEMRTFIRKLIILF